MKISLFQGIVLGAFVLAAIVGVIVFATFSGGSSSSSNPIGNVTVWGSLPQAQIDAALTEIRRSDQTLKGVTYIEKNANTLRSDLISAIAQGKAPDMVLITQESLLSLLKVLQPISATTLSVRTFKDAFATGGEAFLSPDGSGTAGVPFLIDPIVLYENRAILSSSGIATAPTTWEGLTGLVPLITTKTSTGNVSRALIALGTYNNVHNARGILSTLFLQAGVPISTVSANGVKRGDLGVSMLNGTPPGQAVLRFYTQFADSSKVSYTWNASLPDSQSRFLTGDSAFYLGYASEAGYFKQANPNLDFDIAPVPQLQTSGIKTTYGLVYAFAIPRGSANPSGAYQAAAALTNLTSDQSAAIATHMAPADRAVLAARPSDPDLAVAYASALYAKGWLSPAPPDTDSAFSTMINNVITGRFTIDAALSSAESLLSSLLQQ